MPHRKKILLSDSNEALSMLLADSLRERGNFHVFHAKDEDETTKGAPPAPTSRSPAGFSAAAQGRLSRYAASARGRVQNLDDFYDGSADTQGHRGGIPFGRKLCAPEAFYGKGVGRTDTRCTA